MTLFPWASLCDALVQISAPWLIGLPAKNLILGAERQMF